jgi:hypothetical protein
MPVAAGLGNPMMQHVYGIRRAFVVPLGIDTVLLLSLLAISLLQKGDSTEKWILTLFTLPTAYLFLESLVRRIIVMDGNLFVRTLWKRKTILWGEITHVGCLSLPRKVYLLLTTTRGIVILSNAYEEFPLLAADIVERVGPERVEEEVRLQCGGERAGIGNIVLAWVAAAFMVGIIWMKMFPFAI